MESTHTNSAAKIKIDTIPLWAPEAISEISLFLLRLNRKARVLEFGSGGSTIWLGTYAGEVLSLEHDTNYRIAVQQKIEQFEFCNVKLEFSPLPYYSITQSMRDESFDLVIVDGRNRVECIKHSLRLVKSGGMLVLDDAQRTRYSEGRGFLEAFPTRRFFSKNRSTQLWEISREINYPVNATSNPFTIK